ncbi:MAG: D-alanine--D-alanine ligase [Kiritimatiellae bacterium]|nr:D-alanine--D-alanine ligase [Kiritimatiellia bacterium]
MDGKRFRRVAVLMGGASSEAEISLLSGRAVLGALREAGYEASPVELDRATNAFELPAGTEAAFVAVHGAYGEDGGLQARLDALGVPYTGSGAAASRVSFDKILSRAAFAAAGVPVPEGFALAPGEDEGDAPRLALPVVVKPPRQGSSVGVSIVRDAAQWRPAVAEARRFDPEVLVERYVPGREWSVAIAGEEALPPMEIRPKSGWYDWRNKYDDDAGTAYLFPEDDPAEDRALLAAAKETALAAYRAVGGRGVGRVDMRIDPAGRIFVLENNSIPGCTSHSILPKSAAKAGIPFPALCARILEAARCG